MPCNYDDYPANWKTEIRPAVLRRAGQRVGPNTGVVFKEARCEECDARNRAYGWRDKSGRFLEMDEVEAALRKGQDLFAPGGPLDHCLYKNGSRTRPTRIVLTVSHTDHDLTNNDMGNLRALCQRCHLAHDQELHMANARKTRAEKMGQIEIQWQMQN